MKKISLTLRLPEDIYRQFKIKLAENGEKAQAILERAVKEYIKKGGGENNEIGRVGNVYGKEQKSY